jgi:hypothetical protein
MRPCGTTFKFEYLGEFELEIKNILGHESGAHIGVIHEKYRGQKSRATVSLRELLIVYLFPSLCPFLWDGRQ